MKIILLVLSLIFFSTLVVAQSKQIPVSKIANQRVNDMRCLDSSWSISRICPLGQIRCSVVFYFVFVDKGNKTIRLIGRVQVIENIESTGLTGIEIYKGITLGGKLSSRTFIGETTDGGEFISNDGFFDVTMKVEKNESIFFCRYRYYLEEFTVFKLLQ